MQKSLSFAIVFSLALVGTSACKDPSKDVQQAKVEEATKNAMNAVKKAASSQAGAAASQVGAAAKKVGNLAAVTKVNARKVVAYKQAALPEGAKAIDASSKIGFVGSKITGSHSGNFPVFNGFVVPKDGKLAGGRVHVVFDMSKVESDNPKLTGHLKSPDFFDVAKFPTAAFKSTSIEKSKEGLSIKGGLTLHGVTKLITFTAKEKGLNATAEFAINRKDFGIVYPGKPDDAIRDGVVIKLALVVK